MRRFVIAGLIALSVVGLLMVGVDPVKSASAEGTPPPPNAPMPGTYFNVPPMRIETTPPLMTWYRLTGTVWVKEPISENGQGNSYMSEITNPGGIPGGYLKTPVAPGGTETYRFFYPGLPPNQDEGTWEDWTYRYYPAPQGWSNAPVATGTYRSM